MHHSQDQGTEMSFTAFPYTTNSTRDGRSYMWTFFWCLMCYGMIARAVLLQATQYLWWSLVAARANSSHTHTYTLYYTTHKLERHWGSGSVVNFSSPPSSHQTYIRTHVDTLLPPLHTTCCPINLSLAQHKMKNNYYKLYFCSHFSTWWFYVCSHDTLKTKN